MNEILLVDDDPDILKLVSMRLAAAGHSVRAVDSAEKALAAMAVSRPQLVITDLKMGGKDGLTLFDEIHEQAPTLPVIILTAHGTIPDAVAATKRGVFGFLPKPFDGKLLLEQVEQALRLSGAAAPPATGEDWRRDIVTHSPKMEDLLHQARLVAQSDASVFVQGASGTGKEMLARAIHRASRRADGAFVAINCGAIPENLLESELFGHRKGAFTGATYDHRGLIPAADGGTLFLDEIGDMPLALQAKLLRVLQDREVRAVGATQATPVDMRVISATHRDIEALMKEGQFREDLYYRLNVVSLALPPLSERREDIVPLAMHFLKATAARDAKNVHAFAPEALELLRAAPWPGNVRQLLNAVEQVVALSAGGVVPASAVQQALREEPRPLASLEEARGAFEREYLVRILRMTGGNVTQAAKLAQRNRTEFYKLLERHRLEPKSFKPEKA
ncbi:MAG: sigma 54-interacting transcriptional regulator [Betaproteobacteria bacterium]|nr:sigma 54-interacting transcriptional regulator [Betaproteobacteria bacterium]